MRAAAPLLIFLVLVMLTFFIIIAYSVNIPIASVDPVAEKPAMTYSLGKNAVSSDSNEVRSVILSLSGTTVTGATVGLYIRNSGWYSVTVVLRDSGGNTISTGQPPLGCVFLGAGLRSVGVSMSPQVSIDSVYTVQASAARLPSSC